MRSRTRSRSRSWERDRRRSRSREHIRRDRERDRSRPWRNESPPNTRRHDRRFIQSLFQPIRYSNSYSFFPFLQYLVYFTDGVEVVVHHQYAQEYETALTIVIIEPDLETGPRHHFDLGHDQDH